MKKRLSFLILVLTSIMLFSCEKREDEYGSPNYNNSADNDNKNVNNGLNNYNPNITPQPIDTAWYYRFPVNTWVRIKNFYLHDDFVFKSLNIPSNEFYSGDFIVEMWWDGNSTANLRYRCLNSGAVDHMGLPYVITEQIVSFSFIYTGKNTDSLPLYSISFPSGSKLNITYEPQSNTVQRYLDLPQWSGGYTLYKEADGSYNVAQLGDNTPAIFFGPI